MMSSGGPVYFVKKRERTQNWIPEEKTELLALVAEHIGTIENKRLDTTVTTLKNLAWDNIYRDFRRKFTAERDITKIKAQWSRMKSQARIEMYTFAAKVKVLGPDAASKHAPSNLSVSVWRLLQKLRKTDCDGERSDESSQDADGASDVDAILEKFPSSFQPEISFMEFKNEPANDGFGEENVTGSNANNERYPMEKIGERQRLGGSIDCEDPMDRTKRRKKMRVSYGTNHYENIAHENEETEKDGVECSLSPEDISHTEMPVHHAAWMLEASQIEHKLKLRVLNIELERAELEKQRAINELRTSELKKQLMEEQAAQRFSQVRMSSGEAGSGAGRGGGGGGTIRSAGGSFGKMEAAHEDQYFYNQQKEQLQHLREGLHDEISFHEEQIKRHQEAINRHKDRIGKMDK